MLQAQAAGQMRAGGSRVLHAELRESFWKESLSGTGLRWRPAFFVAGPSPPAKQLSKGCPLPPCLICLHLTMSSSRSRRVAAKVWKAGDVAWVKYEAAYRGTLDKRLEGSTTWDVSFDNGDREQVPERLLLRAEPAARPRGDEDITFEEQLERARAMEVTPERKRKGGDSVASAAKLARSVVGGPRDPKVAKNFFQFLY